MSSDPVERLIAPFNPEVNAIALRVRQIIFEVVPDAIEQVDVTSKMIGYNKGTPRTYKHLFCGIVPQTDRVNLMISNGAQLVNERSSLAGLMEGTGKRARHVKLRTTEQANVPEVRELIKAAADAIKP